MLVAVKVTLSRCAIPFGQGRGEVIIPARQVNRRAAPAMEDQQ
jgi:hypothetical protein